MRNLRRFLLIDSLLIFLALTACALPGLNTQRPVNPELFKSAPAGTTSAGGMASPGALPTSSVVPIANPSAHTISIPLVLSDPSATNPQRKQNQIGSNPPVSQSSRNLDPNIIEPVILSLAVAPTQKAPAGIFPKIEVIQSGGGSGSGGEECDSPSGAPHWCRPLDGANISLTQGYQNVACGFDSQPVSGAVILPDGSTRPISVAGQAARCRSVSFIPGPGAPLGTYQLTLNQGSRMLADIFRLAMPTNPEGALFNGCAWLAGWPAGQALRLLAFGLELPGADGLVEDPNLASWRFLAEMSLTPGESRLLLACPDAASQRSFTELAYLALPHSGQAILIGEMETLRQFQGVCADSPSSRLNGAQRARIISPTLPLFPDPALDDAPLAELAKGELLAIRAGPVCPPGGPWMWQVKTPGGKMGWLAESDHSTYFLEPVQ